MSKSSQKRPVPFRTIILCAVLVLVGGYYMLVRQERMSTSLRTAVMQEDSKQVHDLLNSGADANGVAWRSAPDPTFLELLLHGRNPFAFGTVLPASPKPRHITNEHTLLMYA